MLEESIQTNVCSFCEVSHCFVERHAERHMEKSRRHKLRTGNENKCVRCYLDMFIIRDRFGALGKGNRVRLPHIIERYIKRMCPNEDSSYLSEIRREIVIEINCEFNLIFIDHVCLC